MCGCCASCTSLWCASFLQLPNNCAARSRIKEELKQKMNSNMLMHTCETLYICLCNNAGHFQSSVEWSRAMNIVPFSPASPTGVCRSCPSTEEAISKGRSSCSIYALTCTVSYLTAASATYLLRLSLTRFGRAKHSA